MTDTPINPEVPESPAPITEGEVPPAPLSIPAAAFHRSVEEIAEDATLFAMDALYDARNAWREATGGDLPGQLAKRVYTAWYFGVIEAAKDERRRKAQERRNRPSPD